MKQLLCVLLLVVPGVSWANTFKCMKDGQIVYSTEPCEGDAKIVINTNQHAPARDNKETLVLRMNANHAYSSTGSINGIPTTLLIYPSAKTTSISQGAAENAGIHSCNGQDAAAKGNWVTKNCVATLPEITIAGFRVKNLPVSVLPKMTVDAVVGADMLRLFNYKEEDGNLYIAKK